MRPGVMHVVHPSDGLIRNLVGVPPQADLQWCLHPDDGHHAVVGGVVVVDRLLRSRDVGVVDDEDIFRELPIQHRSEQIPSVSMALTERGTIELVAQQRCPHVLAIDILEPQPTP